MQVRKEGESWPSGWARIVGEDGADGIDGIYIDYRFKVAATKPEEPDPSENPDGWSDAPPAVPPGQFLWMTRAPKDAATGELLDQWSDPVRLTGDPGPQGPQGPQGPPG